jgi:hypothetical protein
MLALGLLAFAAAPAAQADGGVFIEQNGLVAMHMEKSSGKYIGSNINDVAQGMN